MASKKKSQRVSKARRSASSAKSSKKSKSTQWPHSERGVLYKPERLKYVRKMIEVQGCVFCAAREAGTSAESLLLYRGEHAMVIMNKYPYNTGHLLVLPTRHCGDLLALTDEENAAVSDLLRKSVAILTKVYNPNGLNVGLNLGEASGAGIPEHLHFHVIPRWRGDTNFFPLVANTKVVVETLEQTFERLIPYFRRL